MSVALQTVSGEKQLELNTGSIAITGIGTSWNHLILAARISITDSGANITSTPDFWFGVMSNPNSGVTNGPLSSAGHFVGIKSTGSTWSRATDPLRYSALCAMRKKVASTITTTSAGATALWSADPAVRLMLFARLVKDSPWSVSMACVDATAGIVDHPTSWFKVGLAAGIGGPSLIASDMESLLGTVGYTNSAIGSIAVDEGTDGPLNAIVVAWNRSVPLIRVSDLSYLVVS